MLSGLANGARVKAQASGCGSDPLTGLANAEAFAEAIAGARPGAATLVLLDLDRLKGINERFGYSVGDRVLQIVADRLQRELPRYAVAARIEGDRFGVLLSNLMRPAEALGFVAWILARLSVPIRQGEVRIDLAASGGAAGLALDHRPRHLLDHAEQALAHAKRAGGGCARIYDPVASLRPDEPFGAADELIRALREREWELHYQPQYRLPDRRLVGAEALLRWRHPTRGLLSPACFLADLEEHSSAHALGRWIVRQACRDLARWRREGLDVPLVSVNLFADQLRRRTLRNVVSAALAENGLAPGDLELEITERVAFDPGGEMLHDLQALRKDGVGIALDDFGTGFASLSTLRRLPISCLKIDRSFVADLQPGSADTAVVRAILALGRDLHLRVVVEGVETQEQTRRLLRMGCRLFQGHHFGTAAAVETFEADQRR